MEARLFLDTLTPQDEYWIGYFRADGHISHNWATVNGVFAQASFNPVLELALYLGLPRNRVISRGQVTNFGFYILHRINSVRLGKIMESVGAKTRLRPDLYESRHFWRGILDGDGSMKLRKSPHLQFCGTQVDVEMFCQFMSKYLDDFSPAIHKRGNVYQTALKGNKAKLIVHVLYDEGYTANIKKYRDVLSILQEPWSTHANSWQPNHA